jgi:hypothetical protein
MTAAEIAFGIEAETTLPGRDATPIGAYHHGLPVAWLPPGWKAEHDSSIRPQVPGRKACEFVGPKLRGPEGLAEVLAAVDAIAARGARVNPTCGLHVSVEFTGDAAALARLISLVGNHEKALFASTGTRRRERDVYAKKIKQYGNKDAAKARCEADRYHALNLTHLARGGNRVEFRVFASTLNKTKVAGYVMLCLGLVELALEPMRCPSWEYTQRPGTRSLFERDGEGESEVVRLFYRLGWTKGWYKGARKDACYGDIRSAAAPTWKETKGKLIELARKYDRQA